MLIVLFLLQCCVRVGSSGRLTGYRPIEKYRGIDDSGVFNVLSKYTTLCFLSFHSMYAVTVAWLVIVNFTWVWQTIDADGRRGIGNKQKMRGH